MPEHGFHAFFQRRRHYQFAGHCRLNLPKQKRIPIGAPSCHDQITAGLLIQCEAVRRSLHIAVADDGNGHCLLDFPNGVPVGVAAVQLGFGSAVYGNCGGTGSFHCLCKGDGVDAVLVPAQPELDCDRYAALPHGSPHDLLCQRNVPHQGTSCTGGNYFMYWTAHVDVDPVRFVLLHQCGGFSHEFRLAAEQLQAHGAFRLGNGAEFCGAFVPVAQPFDGNHFADGGSCPEAAAEQPVGTVGNACHWCQNCRAGQGGLSEGECGLYCLHEGSPYDDV